MTGQFSSSCIFYPAEDTSPNARGNIHGFTWPVTSWVKPEHMEQTEI